MKGFIKLIYLPTCKIYSLLYSVIQIILFSEDWNASIKFLLNQKVVYFEQLIDIGEFNYDKQKCISDNQFFSRYIQSEKNINKILEKIYTPEFKKKLLKLTGFKYRVNYFVLYKTLPLSGVAKDKNIYANFFHFDKPFSMFMSKIFFPIPPVSNKDGPLEIIDSKNKIISMTCTEPKAFFVFPRKTLHRDSIPEEEHERKQIMVQLIPSKKYDISLKIGQSQYKKEPKFPEIKYQMSKIFK